MNQFDCDCYTCDCYDRDAEQCTMSSIDRDYACPIYTCDMEFEEEHQDKKEDMNNDGQRNLQA